MIAAMWGAVIAGRIAGFPDAVRAARPRHLASPTLSFFSTTGIPSCAMRFANKIGKAEARRANGKFLI
jgi:hypothetical protein